MLYHTSSLLRHTVHARDVVELYEYGPCLELSLSFVVDARVLPCMGIDIRPVDAFLHTFCTVSDFFRVAEGRTLSCDRSPFGK